MPFTYAHLRSRLKAEGYAASGPEGFYITAEIIPGRLSIHCHPESGRPREVHVMAFSDDTGWQKISEIGPDEPPEPDSEAAGREQVAPGYLNLLSRWQGKPVGHLGLKNAILADNGLVPEARENVDHLADLLTEALDNAGSDALALAARLAEAVRLAHVMTVPVGQV